MAAQKKNKKEKSKKSSKKIDFQYLIAKSVPLIIIFCFIFAMLVAVRIALLSIPYFTISKINIVSVEFPFQHADELRKSDTLRPLAGKNIFAVDVKKIAGLIREEYPELKKVTVSRIMPNVLEVKINSRSPVAILRLNEFYPVDSECVILPPDIKLNKSLPVISGLNVFNKVKVGEEVVSSQLKSVLLMLKRLKAVDVIAKYRIARVEVSNERSLIIFLDNGLEVRIGHGDITDKLKRLEMILKDPNVDKKNLKYIDLRFKEAVLGLGPR